MDEEIERAFQQALHDNPNWSLGDHGTLETVLVCEKCGDEEVFLSREDATFWLDGLECSACYHAAKRANDESK